MDIKSATNETENTWASEGNLINPIFRYSIPKLVTARCESNHAHNTANTWRHYYRAVNGEIQAGEGVPLNHVMTSNQLDFAEITYIQLDGTHFTVRTNSIQGGFMWMTFITGFWDSLSQIRHQYNDTARQLHMMDYQRGSLRGLQESLCVDLGGKVMLSSLLITYCLNCVWICDAQE